MIIESEDILLAHCKKLIEEKLGWGNSEQWTNQDFEELSQRIFEITAITLSPTTLKRIWGKVKYDSAPTITTLNTLAQFIGFEHWRAFRQNHFQKNNDANPAIAPVHINDEEIKSKTIKRPYLFSFILPLLLVLGTVSWYFLSKDQPTQELINPAYYSFSSKKVVSVGVPNSVIFDYDALKAPYDSVYIQQDWDPSKRVKVSKNQRQHTSVYYYPGSFQAKLVVGNEVVQEHNLFIQTDGWLPMISQKPVPVYFKQQEAINNGKLGLSVEQIQTQNISLKPTAPVVEYANLKDFGDIKTDNFILETSVKNTYREGASVCQYTEIGLLCEGTAIMIRLSAKGCISENNLYFIDHNISGKEHDLSKFGTDFKDFVKVRCESVNGKVKVFIDNQLAYEFPYRSPISKIMGITYRFHGAGLVDNVKITKGNGKIVFEDNFSR
ncbi:hypothetical protein [Emticicia sp. BO119]|uniref:hypothetical protein n=1 Tax=Emticicia sp. BO119 TaxID=2757768 RepID=UPI0015F0541E|nr:hypothetical protein [Emticicia sp. BO119]MBA4852224.1 hypothetical protein [Emticicia sp. BO119]